MECQIKIRWFPESQTINRSSSSHTPRGAYIVDELGWASGNANPNEDLAPNQSLGTPSDGDSSEGADGSTGAVRFEMLTDWIVESGFVFGFVFEVIVNFD